MKKSTKQTSATAPNDNPIILNTVAVVFKLSDVVNFIINKFAKYKVWCMSIPMSTPHKYIFLECVHNFWPMDRLQVMIRIIPQ